MYSLINLDVWVNLGQYITSSSIWLKATEETETELGRWPALIPKFEFWLSYLLAYTDDLNYQVT